MIFINYYQNIDFKDNKYFHGAITYLQNIYGSDLVSEGVIKINVNYPGNSNQKIPVTQRDDAKSYYMSLNKEFNYYEVDLLNNSFYLESYSLRCHGQDYFREWEIHGSNDGIHYRTIDSVKIFQQPSQVTHSQHFTCKYPKIVRYIKFQTKGTRFYGDFIMYLYRIEFFGYFVPVNTIKCTIVNTKQCINMNTYLFIIIFT